MVFSQSSDSCGVKNSFPLSSSGRSTGVPVALFQIPCKSGWPSGVRGGVHAFFAAAGEVLAAVCADSVPAAASIRPASEIKMRKLIALLSDALLRPCGRFAVLAVQKFFDELRAAEFH